MFDEVEHYRALYNWDSSMTTKLKTGGRIGRGRFPRKMGCAR
jgi:hypothetical protein